MEKFQDVPYEDTTQNEILRAQLEMERSTFEAHWRDLGDYILPRRPRWYTTDVNKGERRNTRIIDSTATMAVRTLRSGMMSGITSPARPWFKLATPGGSQDESGAIKMWLDEVQTRMSTVFLKSNLYQVLPIIYGDLGTFGTSAMYMEEDFNNVVRFYPLPIGAYSIGTSNGHTIDILVREFQMTVRQVVERFAPRDGNGKPDVSGFSQYIQSQWANYQSEAWLHVCHVIKPNRDYNPNKNGSKFKKYTSMYYEKGASSSTHPSAGREVHEEKRILSNKGYDFFPALVPRWEVTGEDYYGTFCPGMVALGDIKQLQLGEKRSLQAIEKKVNPPMVGSPALRNANASILPGDITYVDESAGRAAFRPAHEINFQVGELEQKQEQVRQRIRRAFFEDLFLMLASSDRRQITAREIEERHEEKLLALGPVLEQLNQDLLDPLIDNTFSIMLKQDLIPPPPEELQGQELKVEYISIMAEAQKAIGIGSVERFTNFAFQVGQAYPSIQNKIDANKMIDVYGDLLSVPNGIIRSDEEVEQIAEQQAAAQAQQQQLEQLAQGAQVAKQLSETSTDGENALNDLLSQAEAGDLVG